MNRADLLRELGWSDDLIAGVTDIGREQIEVLGKLPEIRPVEAIASQKIVFDQSRSEPIRYR